MRRIQQDIQSITKTNFLIICYLFFVIVKQRELDHINNVQETRLNKLQHQNVDAWKAVKWLRQNRMLFEKTIYEPMILSLNVNDPNMMKYVEFIIPKRDLLAMFIFEVKKLTVLFFLIKFFAFFFFFLKRVQMIWNYL
jgi:hypothetical protein